VVQKIIGDGYTMAIKRITSESPTQILLGSPCAFSASRSLSISSIMSRPGGPSELQRMQPTNTLP
jgi:hypothetical protein